MKYDWTKLTTVVMFGHYDADLMCYAHSKGVRVTLLGLLVYGSIHVFVCLLISRFLGRRECSYG